MDDNEFIKVSFSMRRGVLKQLRTVTKVKHGRIERFQSATMEQLVRDAYAALTEEEKRKAGQDDE